MGDADPLTRAIEDVQAKVEELTTMLGYSPAFTEAMVSLLSERDEQTAVNAIKTAPMLTRLRDGSQWNLDMAAQGAKTEEVEGACILRFPRKPGDRCEVTFVAGDVVIATRH